MYEESMRVCLHNFLTWALRLHRLYEGVHIAQRPRQAETVGSTIGLCTQFIGHGLSSGSVTAP